MKLLQYNYLKTATNQCSHDCYWIFYYYVVFSGQITELQDTVRAKEKELGDSNAKFTQLKTEAKTKIKATKDELQQTSEQLQKVEKGQIRKLLSRLYISGLFYDESYNSGSLGRCDIDY